MKLIELFNTELATWAIDINATNGGKNKNIFTIYDKQFLLNTSKINLFKFKLYLSSISDQDMFPGFNQILSRLSVSDMTSKFIIKTSFDIEHFRQIDNNDDQSSEFTYENGNQFKIISSVINGAVNVLTNSPSIVGIYFTCPTERTSTYSKISEIFANKYDLSLYMFTKDQTSRFLLVDPDKIYQVPQ